MMRALRKPLLGKRIVGLGMVEVLAAMVIFSVGAVLLFGWMSNAAERLGRLRGEQRQLFAQLATLEFAKSLNPMAQPDGELVLADGLRLRWGATRIGEVDAAGGIHGSLYEVALYEVVFRADSKWGELPQQAMTIAGWRQVRSENVNSLFPAGGAR